MKRLLGTSYRSYLHSAPVALLLGVVVVLLSFSVYERFTIEQEMSARRALLEEEVQKLSEKKVVIEEKVEHLQNQRGIEEELRRNFDVAKPGERVVVLTGEVASSSVEATTTPSVQSTSWWQFWR